MARSFRDRFWSPPVAKAVTSPGSILLAAGAAAIAIVATAPLSLPILAVGAIGAAAGGAAYGGRVLLAVPRDPSSERVKPDPFAVHEPWRRFVSDAIDARRRFDDAMRATAKGPLHERLTDIGSRLDDAVDEIWRIARQGNTLVGARQRVDADGVRRELAAIEDQADETWAQGSRLQQTADALRAQIASAERMEVVIADAVDRLRLLDARLDEAVTRAIELSTGATTQGAGAVSGDVDGIVTEMETLRLALDEATAAGSGRAPSASPGLGTALGGGPAGDPTAGSPAAGTSSPPPGGPTGTTSPPAPPTSDPPASGTEPTSNPPASGTEPGHGTPGTEPGQGTGTEPGQGTPGSTAP